MFCPFSHTVSTNLTVYHFNSENWRPKLMGFVFSLYCDFGPGRNHRVLVWFWRMEGLRLDSWNLGWEALQWMQTSPEFPVSQRDASNSSLPHLISSHLMSSLHTGAAGISSFLERRSSVSFHNSLYLKTANRRKNTLTCALVHL